MHNHHLNFEDTIHLQHRGIIAQNLEVDGVYCVPRQSSTIASSPSIPNLNDPSKRRPKEHVYRQHFQRPGGRLSLGNHEEISTYKSQK